MNFDLSETDDDMVLASLWDGNEMMMPSTSSPTTEHVREDDLQHRSSTVVFHCSGEDDSRQSSFSTRFVKNAAFLNHCNPARGCRAPSELRLTMSTYEFEVQHLHDRSVAKFVFGEACMNIQNLMASMQGAGIGDLHDSSHYHRRQQVTHLYHLLLETMHPEQWPMLEAQLIVVRRLLNSLTELGGWRTLYHANSRKGNECTMPAYHFLHGALEWKLLDLCLLHKYDTNKSAASSFHVQLQRVVDDLITCSLYYYAKKCSAALPHSSPFPCTCFKEMWLLLQLAMSKWSASVGLEDLSFWTIFNNAMSQKRKKLDSFSLTELTFGEFANWLLYALARLYGYAENGAFDGPSSARVAGSATAENADFARQSAKALLQAHPSEEQLRVYICLATPTLLEWWHPSVHIPLLLWEHLHNRLNTCFYAASAALSQLAVTCGSGHAYLERYRSLLQQQPEVPDANLSSYTLFVVMLGKMLKRLRSVQATNPAQQLIGRIYTKFSASKLMALNETGVHHLVELILVLALCGDFATLAPKLRDTLFSIEMDKISAARQLAVAKGHMALLELHVELRTGVAEYVQRLLQQLQGVRGSNGPHQVIADGMLDVFAHAENIRLGEHLLIDSWLPNHLCNCTYVEQDRTLEALHHILEKLRRGNLCDEVHQSLLRRLHTHILPFVKQHYATNPSVWMPQLAADFCCVADATTFRQLMTFFVDETPPTVALPQFVLKILRSERGSSMDATTVMRVWLCSLVVLSASHEAVEQLMRHVVALPTFRQMTGLCGETLIAANEPLCMFVAAVGKGYEECMLDYQRRIELAELFNGVVRNFEKWLPPDPKHEQTETLFRFYNFVAIVIYNCPHIVYSKSRITCFLHVAMTQFILPTGLQMGKSPGLRQAQLMHKIWPMIVQGVGRLSFTTDPYIGKTITDLVLKWTPHFNISPSPKVVARPFIVCFQDTANDKLSLFVLEKLAGHFLSGQANPHAGLALSICQEVLIAGTTSPCDAANECRLDTFLQAAGIHILEHFMTVSSNRSQVLELLRHLVGSATYRNSGRARELFVGYLRLLGKIHLKFNTSLYLDMLGEIAKISYEVVEDCVVAEARLAEQKRTADDNSWSNDVLQQLRRNVDNAKASKNLLNA